MTSQRPIGWYLKEADRLITEVANAAFAEKDITRFHWQVLTTVDKSGTARIKQMYPGVRNFVSEAQLRQIFQSLVDRGWLVRETTEDDFGVEFTPLGRDEFARVLEIQQGFLKRLMNGISDEDYQSTIKVLTQIVVNLGGSP